MYLGIKRNPYAFLILMQGESDDCQKIKAISRQVRLKQFGQWMMGTAKICKRPITLTGCYGNSGLPVTVSDQIYKAYGVELPEWLVEMWNKGGGWNDCGSEGNSMREWAVKNYPRLQARNKLRHKPTGLPNLEGMDDDELKALKSELIRKEKTCLEEWFGETQVKCDIRGLISALLLARDYRRDGWIESAMSYEVLFENELKQIPERFRY